MSEKLKPCPFCGGEVKLTTYRDEGWEITCENHDWPNATWERPRKASDIAADVDMCSWGLGEDAKAALIAAWNARADTEYGSVPATDENMAKHGWVRERTCRMEYQTEGMQRGWWKCSECGEAMDTIEACAGRKPPRWCGNCGAKVVGE